MNSTLDVGSPVFDFVVKVKDGSAVTSSVAVPITEELTFQFSGEENNRATTSTRFLISGSTTVVYRQLIIVY